MPRLRPSAPVVPLTGRSDIADGATYADSFAGFRLGKNSFHVGIGGFATGLLMVAIMVDKLGRRALIEGHVDPVYRGRGLGAAMLDWALAEAGASPTIVKTRSLTAEKRQLFESRGPRACAAIEHLSMPLDPPIEPRPLPPGVAITDWDAEDGYRLYAKTFADLPGNPFALNEEPGSITRIRLHRAGAAR